MNDEEHLNVLKRLFPDISETTLKQQILRAKIERDNIVIPEIDKNPDESIIDLTEGKYQTRYERCRENYKEMCLDKYSNDFWGLRK